MLVRLTISHLQCKILEKYVKMALGVLHTQFKCLLKAFIFGTYNYDIFSGKILGGGPNVFCHVHVLK